MVNSIKLFAILFFVLPALVAANACQVSVSHTLTNSENRYNTYKGVITNLGNVPVDNVRLVPSEELHTVEGLTERKGGYELPSGVGNIDVDASYTFSYTAKADNNVKWDESCEAAAGARSDHNDDSNSHHTTTKKPSHTTTTTKKPSHTTTQKQTSTKAPASTSTKAPSTTTTTKAPSTSTKAASTTTTKTTSESSNGRKCPTGTWWAPSPMTTYQWQLTGTIDTSVDVQMYDIDLFDNTEATISTLHSKGRVVICYFSTQYEDWRSDSSSFTSAVIGNALDGWEGENYVDIRSTVVRNIMAARMDLAVSKGCDGLEPDNVDGYTAKTGFPLTAADQLNFNEFIATQAHARGLSVGLKNDIDQAAALEPFFDWALNEQCYEYSECASLNTFISHGKAVFNTEYSGTAAKVCPYMVGLKFSSLIKTLDLTAHIKSQCCTYATGGCAAAPVSQCISTDSSLMVDNAPLLETDPVEDFVASATTAYASMFVLAAAALVAMNL